MVGLLQIQLPEAVEGTELDIILVYEPASPKIEVAKLSDRFYGCIQDETFVRHPQPEEKTEKPSLASLYGICADDPIIIDDEGILESLNDNLLWQDIFDLKYTELFAEAIALRLFLVWSSCDRLF